MVNPLDSQYIEASNPERHYLKGLANCPSRSRCLGSGMSRAPWPERLPGFVQALLNPLPVTAEYFDTPGPGLAERQRNQVDRLALHEPQDKAVGVHLARGVDPVRQLTGSDDGSRENDLAGEQAVGGGRAGQPQHGVHGARPGFLAFGVCEARPIRQAQAGKEPPKLIEEPPERGETGRTMHSVHSLPGRPCYRS